MATVLIVVYLLIVIALIVVILLQRSEGGGLGMGGGSGGLISARGSANLLTRTTAILGTLFMVTAIGLTIVSQLDNSSTSILDRAVDGEGAPTTVLDALDTLSGGPRPDLAVPEDAAPAEDAAAGGEADLALPAETPVTEAPAVEAPAADAPAAGDAAQGAPAETPPAAAE